MGFHNFLIMVTWSARIRALRAHGMTLAEIGEAVGLSPASICDIERERTKTPRGDAALALHALYARQLRRSKHARRRGPEAA